MSFAWTIVAFVVVLAICWRFLGAYMVTVFNGRSTWLSFVERPLYRLLKVDPESEQSWQRYAVSVTMFTGVALLFGYGIFRLQGHLPFNPQHFGAVREDTAWNTVVSFVTNTNWQAYSGETTMSYLSQMGVLALQNFLSAAVGIAVAVALIRGFARRGSKTIGNFWVDFVRSNLYVLLPIAFVAAIVFIGQGALETLSGPAHVHNALTGVDQTLPRGPIASQEVIKQLGTNGGGFFNANGAGPFENPSGLTNFLSIILILCIPVALTYTFGKMVFSVRQGVAILAVMTVLFGGWLTMATVAEHQGNPAVAAAGVTEQPTGNMEGKETRFGAPSSALYNITSTQTSTGSVDSAADSYTAIGGGAMLTGMMLGEVSPGGVGTGLYGILLFAVITVFIGGLMVGRTPEYLGKKIQAREVKLAALGVLVMPITVLVLTAIAVSVHAGRVGPLNAGPHGFSEILYAYTSQTNNNGSGFGGLSANTPFYNITGTIGLLLGRFGMIIPVLALAGSLAAKQVVPASLGTFRTDKPMFAVLLLGIVLIVGALTFFPAVSLGPIVEQFSGGRLF
ncbi:potassium-transporting ATPase subunit KdpA [Rugosimonospora africana]|uniref:Potassium-transporting ATPase potassium-binding subunit n=1 Tax=Rugosimonospora africana TaxID=556532 RepID=A0A8J3QSU2_9ACTN|nr:potassium-transporting ATPase subunit KdpA [Rugosimonospora africana]GIH15367.1 potassium-transporting ATPase potassium-binding subunit [Rugosimonospora africana]